MFGAVLAGTHYCAFRRCHFNGALRHAPRCRAHNRYEPDQYLLGAHTRSCGNASSHCPSSLGPDRVDTLVRLRHFGCFRPKTCCSANRSTARPSTRSGRLELVERRETASSATGRRKRQLRELPRISAPTMQFPASRGCRAARTPRLRSGCPELVEGQGSLPQHVSGLNTLPPCGALCGAWRGCRRQH